MIAFASLFLGLVLGLQPVEMVAGNGVTRVELRLDGETVETADSAPFLFDCDFGTELAPRHLEAIAFNAEGQEVGRVAQWLNLPQPKAVISVALEPREPGKPRVARLSWESSVGVEPKSVNASLDGVPLKVKDPRRLELPVQDDKMLHLLTIEMRFKGRHKSRVDFTFGGLYADEVSTEMTALPMWSSGKANARPPSLEEVQEWFRIGDQKLRVIAVERESAEIVIVMDRPFPLLSQPVRMPQIARSLELGDDLAVRFLATTPEQRQGVMTTFDLFPISPAYGRAQGNLYRLLTSISRPPNNGLPRSTTASVAVAGLAAYEGRQRRAVVLIPGAQESDAGEVSVDASEVLEEWSDELWGGNELSAGQIRRYLERLRVPYYVWNPDKDSDPKIEAWGDVKAAGSPVRLSKAFAELREDLDRQWIVWIDGQHLPQNITLANGVSGFSLTP